MSNQENENQPVTEEQKQPTDVQTKKTAVSHFLATLMKIKQDNPALFFGGVGAFLVVGAWLLAMAGSDGGPVKQSAIKELKLGQRYVLKGANTYDALSTVRLVSVPGAIAAYDDSEESDRTRACQHMAQGTPVTALAFADAYGKKNSYVKVRIETGECKGNEAWALAIDVK